MTAKAVACQPRSPQRLDPWTMPMSSVSSSSTARENSTAKPPERSSSVYLQRATTACWKRTVSLVVIVWLLVFSPGSCPSQ